jgi:hypothetical protein
LRQWHTHSSGNGSRTTPRQQQQYNQGAPQQARQPAGYDARYDQQQQQQYDDYGYDQHGQYEQWDDGYNNHGGGWDHAHQQGYGDMSDQQPRQQQRRAPSQDYGYDQQYRQPPQQPPPPQQQQRDPRGVPMGRGGGGQGAMRQARKSTEESCGSLSD